MRNCDIKFVNKEITPFAGLSLFFKMLEKCHFEEHVMQSGVPLQGSNRGYKPIQLILGLFAGVWCGANCFGHLDVVRYDAALCDLLGWERGADHRAYHSAINNRIKYSLTHERKWIELTDGLEISETIYQANGWEKPKRIVMVVRQELSDTS